MERKLFTDLINALGKVAGGIRLSKSKGPWSNFPNVSHRNSEHI